MADTLNVLPYAVGERRMGIPLESVIKVVRAAEITALPETPGTIAGMINVQGSVVPVVNMRVKFGAEFEPVALSDIFVIVQTERGAAALWVESVDSAQEFTIDDLDPSGEILADMDFVTAVVGRQRESRGLAHG